MVNVNELRIGEHVMARGVKGTVAAVDHHGERVLFRADPQAPQFSKEGVLIPPSPDAWVPVSEIELEVLPEPVRPVGPASGAVVTRSAAVPTTGQITAARERARVLWVAQGLQGKALEDAQDEAEAALVARGEPA
jgi:hypothetical protein